MRAFRVAHESLDDLMDPRERRAREIHDAIRDVLMADWDPIGIAEEPACADEYDRYIGGLYRLLASGAQPEEIADHLLRIEHEPMGLDKASRDGLLPVATKLRGLDVRL